MQRSPHRIKQDTKRARQHKTKTRLNAKALLAQQRKTTKELLTFRGRMPYESVRSS